MHVFTGTNLVLGLVYGEIYGLLAIGIVLVYRGSRVLNFAQGEIGTTGLFAAWFLCTEQGLPWIVGAAGAIAVSTGIGLGFERLIVRPMGSSSRLAVAVATVGLSLFLFGAGTRLNGPTPRSVPPVIRGKGFSIAHVFVSPTQLVALVVGVAAVFALTLLLRRTDFGLAVLAAADDPVAVRLVGVSAARVSAFTWGVASALSAIALLLIAPSIGVFVPGFASVGGLAVGLIYVFVKSATITSGFPGAYNLAIFGLIVVVLIVRPTGLLPGPKVREA